MARLALIAAALAGLPTVGLACMPVMIAPAPFPVQGPDCALRIDLSEIDSVHLGPAQRLGGGLALQTLSDGNGCYNRHHLVIHDCPSGRVMVIGAERFAIMDEAGSARRPGLEVIRDAALAARDAGRVQALDDFAAASRAQGYGAPQVLRTDQSLRYDRQTLPLSCACRTARGGG